MGQPRRLGRPPNDEVGEGQRRAEILRVAADRFARRGYAAVSLAEIAAGVGVTKATILHHFGSKEGLYAEVMRRTLDAIGAAIRRIAEGPQPFPAKLHALAQTAIVWVDAEADLDAMLHDADQHLAPAARQEVAAAHHAIAAAVEDLMARGIAAGDLAAQDPRLLAHAFWHLLAAFGGRVGAQASFQGRPEVAETVVDLFLGGAAGGAHSAKEPR